MTTLTTSAHIVDFVESPSFYHEDLQAKFFIQLEAWIEDSDSVNLKKYIETINKWTLLRLAGTSRQDFQLRSLHR